MLSVIIPTVTDTYLAQTVTSLFSQAGGRVEVIVVYDGYIPADTIHLPNVTNILLERVGMRECINTGMRKARGDFVMKIDEHCMVDTNYDIVLSENCEADWLVVPRRYR